MAKMEYNPNVPGLPAQIQKLPSSYGQKPKPKAHPPVQHHHLNLQAEQPAKQKTPTPTDGNPPGTMSVLGDKLNLDGLQIEQLNQVHEKLISVILTEEEDLIAKHREQLDKMCEYSRQVF
jgi:hypothetical protein